MKIKDVVARVQQAHKAKGEIGVRQELGPTLVDLIEFSLKPFKDRAIKKPESIKALFRDLFSRYTSLKAQLDTFFLENKCPVEMVPVEEFRIMVAKVLKMTPAEQVFCLDKVVYEPET